MEFIDGKTWHGPVTRTHLLVCISATCIVYPTKKKSSCAKNQSRRPLCQSQREEQTSDKLFRVKAQVEKWPGPSREPQQTRGNYENQNNTRSNALLGNNTQNLYKMR